MINGIIVKGIGGFYYVEADGKTYECRARGIFRKNKIKPLVGDKVAISVRENAENTIDEIFERAVEFSRPPVANVDSLFIISSVREPKPALFVIDRLTALATCKGVEPIVVFTKSDLASADEYVKIYQKAGIRTIAVSCVNGGGINEVAALLKNRTSAFCGNTGVGKSSLLNAIEPKLALETGEISCKLGRGRHTTRHSELFKIAGGYAVDAPGFSSLEEEEDELISKEELPFAFKEFRPYLGECKFASCLHVKDKGCRIIRAVEEGDIPASRHESYRLMMERVRNVGDWELKQYKK